MKKKSLPAVRVKLVPLPKDREAEFSRALEVLMRLGRKGNARKRPGG